VVARGISTAADTVLAVSLVAAAATALVVLAPVATPAPPDAGPALDALAVTTATVNAAASPVRASLATHLVAAANLPRGSYARAVRTAVSARLDSLPGRAEILVLNDASRAFAVGPTPPPDADVSAASLPVGNATVVLRRWWA